MKHVVPHDLDQDTARRVTDKAFSAYKDRFAEYNPTLQWVNDQRAEVGFSAKGISLKGAFELKPGQIEMDLDVPFLLRPFKGKAISVIDEEIKRWIGKAKAGEL
ncbi:MAG TPA: polyhydroxyalkanoic acid system family protein [Candidatus Nanopelagicales bacterium]|nr:polyhydroxyalkanoic acid system family protein [Candidatus Nanopelagicales bacterium]